MAENKFTLIIRGPDGFDLVFPVAIGITRFGRQPGNTVVLPHTQVSRVHAQLETTARECVLTDLGSSNGTSLNGEKLAPQSPVALKDSDRVKIGPFEMAIRQETVASTDTREIRPPEIDPSVVSVVEPPPPDEPPPPELELEPTAEAPELKKASAARKKPAKPAASPARPPAEGDGPPPPSPPAAGLNGRANGHPKALPGLSTHSTKLLEFLPGIFHSDFMSRFLAIFEATQLPIEWTIDNFDLFLDPGTAPADFLPWLSSWFGIGFDASWTEEKRRMLLQEAHAIYARRGTRWALSRVLEIYTGVAPEIVDLDEKMDPFTFTVTLPLRKRDVQVGLVEALIEAHKPAHTNYVLAFKPN